MARLFACPVGYKTSETLLGIETQHLEALQGIDHQSYKTSETLLGIETTVETAIEIQDSRYKTSETLLGIETHFLPVNKI